MNKMQCDVCGEIEERPCKMAWSDINLTLSINGEKIDVSYDICENCIKTIAPEINDVIVRTIVRKKIGE